MRSCKIENYFWNISQKLFFRLKISLKKNKVNYLFSDNGQCKCKLNISKQNLSKSFIFTTFFSLWIYMKSKCMLNFQIYSIKLYLDVLQWCSSHTTWHLLTSCADLLYKLLSDTFTSQYPSILSFFLGKYQLLRFHIKI